MAGFKQQHQTASTLSGGYREEEDDSLSLSDDEFSEVKGPFRFLKNQMESGVRPEVVLKNIFGPSVHIPQDADEVSLWEAVLELMFRPPARDPLPNVSTFDDVVRLIDQSKNIIVLSGAGISVSCGIPDFRSPNGLYSRLSVEFPDLIEPQSMFDIKFFELDPKPFFKFAKEIFPGKYAPSPCHRFIATLEQRGKLLRNYTQNIDTIERSAGITKVLYCHGSFRTATCRKCHHQVPIEDLKDIILREEVPYCVECTRVKADYERKKPKKTSIVEEDDDIVVGVMKPDIVFFGEGLPDAFHKQLQEDKTKADLLIVMGSSLKVRPVSLIPDTLPDHVPRILINRERLQYIRGFDVRLLGYGDTVVRELCNRLGSDWVESVGGATSLDSSSPEERIHLFDGAMWSKETAHEDSVTTTPPSTSDSVTTTPPSTSESVTTTPPLITESNSIVSHATDDEEVLTPTNSRKRSLADDGGCVNESGTNTLTVAAKIFKQDGTKK